ncbi:hypothetical protein [Streptomyces niveiscabiei]|uniref:hypothetical protein n=1 Tax=Streptomyces niveiscabiei TaxID=164115 RepID=UPI0038F657AB
MTSSDPSQVIWTPIDTDRIRRVRGRRRTALAAGAAALLTLTLAGVGWGLSGNSAEVDAPKLLGVDAPHTRAGAQSAAAAVAAALGGERMYATGSRRELLRAIVPADRPEVARQYDSQYGEFAERIGLDDQGRPPTGSTFVSRTMPAGTTVRSYTGLTASVDVWSNSLFGLTGKEIEDPEPVGSSWLTITVDLTWTPDGWRMTDSDQRDGPQPTDAGVDAGAAPQL